MPLQSRQASKLAHRLRALLAARWFQRLIPALLLSGIAILSLVPGDLRPHAPILPDAYEHLLAYALTAFAIAALPSHTLRSRWLFAGLAAYAGLLEICQFVVPNRTTSLEDFLASSAGAALGILLAGVARYCVLATLRLISD